MTNRLDQDSPRPHSSPEAAGAPEALRVSEMRYRRLFESARDGILILDASSRKITDANPFMVELLGYSREEFLGKELWEIGLLKDAEASAEAFRELQRTGYLRYEDLPLRSKSGLKREVEVVSNVYAEGEKLVVQCNIRDISERKRAEAALWASEERFRTFMDNMPARAFIKDENGRYVYLNQAVINFTQAPLEELLGKSNADRLPQETARVLAAHDLQVLESGQAQQFEEILPDIQGQPRHELVVKFPLHGLGGEPLLGGVAVDITERKQAEQALQWAHDRLEERVAERMAELEKANAALETQIAEREDAEARVRTRARQQEAVAELGRRALAGADLQTLLHGAVSLSAAVLEVDHGLLIERLPGAEEAQIQAAIGGARHLLHTKTLVKSGFVLEEVLSSAIPVIINDIRTEERFAASPLAGDHSVRSIAAVRIVATHLPAESDSYGALAVASTAPNAFSETDGNFLQSIGNILAAAIEQRRAQEAVQQAQQEAERANQAKSEFLSRMSHELRTPLNAILGFAQVLGIRASSTRDQEAIEHILQGGEHLLGLINEVLDLARIESGHLHVSLAPVDVARVLQDVVALVAPIATRYSVSVHIEGVERGASEVVADVQHLKQVLINLLSNAIKYNRPHGHVFLRGVAASEGQARILVRDDGPGIAPEDLPKLFRPFERLGASQSAVEGTGLGLSLCRGMMQSMGGTIGIESERGRGTTAWVQLPATASVSEPDLPEPAPLPKNTHSVLLIEDELVNLRLVEHIFAMQPHIELISAMQGQAGYEMAREKQPELILLDLNLPDIMGDEVLRRLKSDATTAAIPVVIVSADATPSQIESLKAAGATEYLTKPINLSIFMKTVDGLLNSHS